MCAQTIDILPALWPDRDDLQSYDRLSAEDKLTLTTWIMQTFAPVGFGFKRLPSSAYALKHRFERAASGFYITEAQFTAAMLATGLTPVDSTGAAWYFNITTYDATMARPHYIYTLTDPRDQVVRYVGQTYDLPLRLRQHLRGHAMGPWWEWFRALRQVKLRPQIVEVETLVLRDGDLPSRFMRLQDFMARVDMAECWWIQYYQQQGAPLLNKQLARQNR